jgi:thiamine transport system ATP-binding protein
MLHLNQLHYRYHKALFCFDAGIRPGSITAVMGPSGAGKSTLLALVAGFISPEQGEILVDGQAVQGLEPHQRPFAMLFQEHNLFSHLTVRQNIGLGLHPGLKLSREQQQQVVQAAEQVGIADYLDRLPAQLSGGQRQRVALARCFVQPHPIWLLDEPFSALDPILRNEMLQLVQRLAAERNITVLMVTHHISDARAIATDFLFVEDGQSRLCQPIAQLRADSADAGLAAFVAAGE